MTDDLHPRADELQEELGELLQEDSEVDFSKAVFSHESTRSRGILSKADRKYLAGQKEYEHPQSESNRKQEIRERVINGFQDFSALVFSLSEEERNKIFNDVSEKEYQDPLVSVIAFLYLGLDEDVGKLERIIEKGIYMGANFSKLGRWSGEVADVDTSISIERRPDRSEIIEKFNQGKTDQLTPAEIGILVRAGKLDGDDLTDLEDTTLPYPFATQKKE